MADERPDQHMDRHHVVLRGGRHDLGGVMLQCTCGWTQELDELHCTPEEAWFKEQRHRIAAASAEPVRT